MAVDRGQFDQAILEAGSRWSRGFSVAVPFDLVKRIIRVESTFDPSAVRREPDGRISRGLMQVLEDTARELGLRDPLQLHRPAVGIDYGVKYLAKQLARYRGDVRRAVAAYNAGTARPSRLDPRRFVNQAYVDKVLGIARAGALPFALVAAAVVALLFVRRRARGSHA